MMSCPEFSKKLFLQDGENKYINGDWEKHVANCKYCQDEIQFESILNNHFSFIPSPFPLESLVMDQIDAFIQLKRTYRILICASFLFCIITGGALLKSFKVPLYETFISSMYSYISYVSFLSLNTFKDGLLSFETIWENINYILQMIESFTSSYVSIEMIHISFNSTLFFALISLVSLGGTAYYIKKNKGILSNS